MRSVVEIGASVPAFLGKLWKLVNDSETNHLISWSPVSIFPLLKLYIFCFRAYKLNCEIITKALDCFVLESHTKQPIL